MPARGSLLAALAIALVVLLPRLSLLGLPLERDEGAYATAARELRLGATLYRDVFEHKPPGIVLGYRLAFAVAGESVTAVRLLALLAALATSLALAALGRRTGHPEQGLLAAVLYAASSALPAYHGGTANTEMLLAFPLVAGLALGSSSRAVPRAWPVAAGALLGTLVWFKPTAAVVALWALAHLALAGSGGGRHARIATALRLALGSLLPTFAVATWLFAIGAGRDFAGAVLAFNRRYAAAAAELLGDGRWDYFLDRSLATVAGDPLPWIAVPIGLALLWRRHPREPFWLASGWLATSLLQTLPGLFFPHYLQAALPALAWVAAGTLDAARAPLAGAWPRSGPLARLGPRRGSLAIALMFVPAVALGATARYWLVADAGMKMAAMYGREPFLASPPIAHWIAARTGPEDSLLVLGAAPELYFLADRRPASRYLYSYPLAADLDPGGEARAEVLASLAARRPKVVAVYALHGSWPFRPQENGRWFSSIRAELERGYRLEQVLDWPEGTAAAPGTIAITASQAPIQLWLRR